MRAFLHYVYNGGWAACEEVCAAHCREGGVWARLVLLEPDACPATPRPSASLASPIAALTSVPLRLPPLCPRRHGGLPRAPGGGGCPARGPVLRMPPPGAPLRAAPGHAAARQGEARQGARARRGRCAGLAGAAGAGVRRLAALLRGRWRHERAWGINEDSGRACRLHRDTQCMACVAASAASCLPLLSLPLAYPPPPPPPQCRHNLQPWLTPPLPCSLWPTTTGCST